MKIFIPSIYILLSTIRVLANEERVMDYLSLVKSRDYYMSMTRTFEFNPAVRDAKQPKFQKNIDLGVFRGEFAKRGDEKAYRCIRILGNGEIEFEAHAVSDGEVMNNVHFDSGMRTLFVKPARNKLFSEIRGINILELPWTWLAVENPKDILNPDPIVWDEKTKDRLLALLPLATKSEFFDLPHAPGIRCKIIFDDNLSKIQQVTMIADEIGLKWSCVVTDELSVAYDGGKTLSLPKKIKMTADVKDYGIVKQDMVLDSFTQGDTIPGDIFDLDVSKADLIWDEEAKMHLKVK